MTGRPLVNFKYRSGAAALRSLSDGTCYFSRAGELNDSLEAKFAPVDFSSYARALAQILTELAGQRKEQARYEPEEESAERLSKLIREEDEIFAINCQRVGIFSGTKRPDNQPMWAYYCNDGRGVCFEFEWPSDLLKQFSLRPTFVHYTDQPRIHNRFEDMREELLALGESTRTGARSNFTSTRKPQNSLQDRLHAQCHAPYPPSIQTGRMSTSCGC